MNIASAVQKRDISELLHFTTHFGLVGILDSRLLRSRNRLKHNQRLEHILMLNTPRILDVGWEDYVNLSISRINYTLFDISGSWHNNVWWRILSFDPTIMTHHGVFFSTTNNAYHQHLLRGTDYIDFERLFAPSVAARYGQIVRRKEGMLPKFTTCPQAEVLYPGEITTNFLRKIYVATGEDSDDVHAQIEAVGHPPVEILISPEKFRGES